MKTSPKLIKSLKPHEIFVFGSNLSGIHGAGAAQTARIKFGAQNGEGEGVTGECYAIPTKDYGIRRTLTVAEIKPYVDQFIRYARYRQQLTFLVTEIGCGLAGYKPEQIAPLFKDALDLVNILLPKSFVEILKNKERDNVK